jgi:PAS domain S-box-containing protein
MLQRQSVLLEQSLLLELSAAHNLDFEGNLRQILKSDAELLDVERVSYWSLELQPRAILCRALYLRSRDTLEGGARALFLESDCPRYYRALREDLHIAAHDARTDERTSEFSEGYLVPLGITSLLDVPVWVRGRLGGVICHEHVGPARYWTTEEQAFARSIGHVLSMALETAERRKAEESLRQSEERFRLLVDGVKDYAHILLDPQGRVASWNTGAERIMGYRTEEVLERHFSMFYPKESVEGGKPELLLLRALDEGRVEIEGWRVRRNGSRFWASEVLTPLRDGDGRLRGYAEICRDMSERRWAEQQQRLLAATSAAEQQQRLLAEVSAALVSSLDHTAGLTAVAYRMCPLMADTCLIHLKNEEGELQRIACVHASAEHSEERCRLLDESLGGARRPDDVDQALRTGAPVLLTRRAFRYDGTRSIKHPQLLQVLRLSSVLLVPLIARGETLGMFTLARGEPGRRFGKGDLALAEELARRAASVVDKSRLYQQAQSAISLRDEFLTIASHELRTPVTALHLQLQCLRRSVEQKGGMEKALQAKFLTAQRQTERLSKLIESLLDVSRITSGRLLFELEEMDLAQLARQVAAQFQEEASRAGCQLVLRADAPVMGWWDRLRIEQVLSNLLSNAIKYAPENPITVCVEAKGELARLMVTDRGIGISEENLARIFGRFERAVSSRHYGGLGLGLFVSQKVVEGHGGTIEVTSRPGVGSTFTVWLPRAVTVVPCKMPPEDKLSGVTSQSPIHAGP